MLGYFGSFWDTWNANHKVTFDGINKLIIINYGVVNIEVKSDLYSAWKEWSRFHETQNLKFAEAFRVVGGDPTIGDNIITPYFYLQNGWKIRPFEGNHSLEVSGILLTETGDSPFIPTLGAFNTGINSCSTS